MRSISLVRPSPPWFRTTRFSISFEKPWFWRRSLNQRLTLIKVAPFYAATLLERGARAEAEATLASVADLDATLGYPQARWRLPMLRAGFSLSKVVWKRPSGSETRPSSWREQAGAIAGTEWALQRIAIAIARQDRAQITAHAARILSILARGPFAVSMRAWILGSDREA